MIPFFNDGRLHMIHCVLKILSECVNYAQVSTNTDFMMNESLRSISFYIDWDESAI